MGTTSQKTRTGATKDIFNASSPGFLYTVIVSALTIFAFFMICSISTNSTGTAAAGLGPGLLFKGETTTTDNQDMVQLASVWSSATHASRTAALVFSNVTSGGAMTERFRFTAFGMTFATPYIIGNSSHEITVGGGSGAITIKSSNTGATPIQLNPEANAATSTAGITVLSGVTLTQTSGTRNLFNFSSNFSPTSGTAIHNQLSFTGTLNQTGGANGIVRGINLAHTMTAVADYRAIEIADDHANAHGIYQSGSSTKNVFVGKTGFGATTAPTALVMLAAGTASANTAPLKFTSGTNLTAVENGAVEYDGTDFTMTSESLRRNVLRSTTGRLTGQTAAASSVATLTVGAADATYMVSGNILITTDNAAQAIQLVVDYTDEGNTARSVAIPLLRISATSWLTSTLGGGGAVPYPSSPLPIRCKASTTITIKTIGAFTSTTYNVEGTIVKI